MFLCYRCLSYLVFKLGCRFVIDFNDQCCQVSICIDVNFINFFIVVIGNKGIFMGNFQKLEFGQFSIFQIYGKSKFWIYFCVNYLQFYVVFLNYKNWLILIFVYDIFFFNIFDLMMKILVEKFKLGIGVVKFLIIYI